jgi:hypothetical protein
VASVSMSPTYLLRQALLLSSRLIGMAITRSIDSVQGGYEITAKNSGLQLQVAGGPSATQDGVPVIQWPCWGGSSEIWQVSPAADGYLLIVASRLDRRIPVSDESYARGQHMLMPVPSPSFTSQRTAENQSFPETPRSE